MKVLGILIALGIALGIMAAVVAAILASSESPGPQAVPDPPSARAVVRSTATPRSTHTPRPRPTRTPTSEPCETEAARQYMGELWPLLEDVGTAVYEIGVLFAEAGNNAYLILDEDWRADVVLYMVVLEWVLESIEGLTPPPVFAGSHNLMLMAVDEYRLFMGAARSGIDNLDVDALLRAQAHLEEAVALTEQFHNVWQQRCE